MRADAQRNQHRILDAARAQITEHGPDASMDQIAKTAGVAVGTLYRHYPTKRDLVRAVLVEFAETLIAGAERAADSVAAPGDAMAAIRGALQQFLDQAADDTAIKEAAGVLNVLDADYFTPELEARGRAAIDRLLAAAAADGQLRAGVTADDILMLLFSAPTNLPAPARERWLEIVMPGLTR
jgi:AcrR family transcriptional regulator